MKVADGATTAAALRNVMLAIAAVSTVAMLVATPAWWLFGLPALLVTWRAHAYYARRAARDAEVAIDETGVSLDGLTRIEAKDIAGGFFLPGDEPRVRLVRDDGVTLFEGVVEDEEDALAILGALGRAPAQRRARFVGAPPRILRARSRAFAGVVGAAAGMAALSLSHTSPAALLLGAASAWLFACAFAPAPLFDVGVDGIMVTRTLGHRFHSFDDIVSVTPDGEAAALVLRSGDIVRLPFDLKSGGEGREQLDAFVARAAEAIALRRGSVKIAALARGDRDAATWAKHLASLREGSYRHGAIRDEDLAQALQDPASPPDVRIAAAWLLGRQGGDAKARVRVAAEAMAEPQVRIAIERVAESDDLAEALEAAESAEEARVRDE